MNPGDVSTSPIPPTPEQAKITTSALSTSLQRGRNNQPAGDDEFQGLLHRDRNGNHGFLWDNEEKTGGGVGSGGDEHIHGLLADQVLETLCLRGRDEAEGVQSRSWVLQYHHLTKCPPSRQREGVKELLRGCINVLHQRDAKKQTFRHRHQLSPNHL